MSIFANGFISENADALTGPTFVGVLAGPAPAGRGGLPVGEGGVVLGAGGGGQAGRPRRVPPFDVLRQLHERHVVDEVRALVPAADRFRRVLRVCATFSSNTAVSPSALPGVHEQAVHGERGGFALAEVVLAHGHADLLWAQGLAAAAGGGTQKSSCIL